MRTFFVFVFALFALSARAEIVPNQTPEALIEFIYKHYVGKSATDDANFDWTEKPMVDAIFEPELARAIEKAGQSDEPIIDGDPFVNAQDYEVKSMTLVAGPRTDQRARIDAKIVNFNEPATIGYELVKIGNSWRIRDIVWGGDDPDTFRKLLKLP